MNFKYVIVLVTVLISSLLTIGFSSNSFEEEPVKFSLPKMCNELKARCTGSAYCTACKNCSRCAYCNSGGSCGVCGKSVRTYRTKKKKKNTSTPKYNIKKSTSSPNYQPAYLKEDIYVLKQKTSLRQAANSKSNVLKRLAKNDSVLILDGFSEKYWCKVIHQGKEGWVKKHLLEKRKVGIYP